MKNNCIKVILSTFGPLHLLKSAEYLEPLVDIKVIQSWIPCWWNCWILSLASKLAGRNLYKTFKKRTPSCLEGRNHSVALPEFYLFAHKLLKFGNPLDYQQKAAQIYGKCSKKYIKDGDVFHVRSGSGRGGAIEKAKSLGMKVVVDHSIAHPAFMDRHLRMEYEKNGARFELGMDNPFWQAIVDDCEKADCLLVNSQFVKDTFVAEGYDAKKIKVVYLGVRKDFVGLKKDYSCNHPLRILFTGGFGFRKGAEFILRALCELDKRGIDYEMTIVGDYTGGLALYKKYKPRHVTFVNTVPQDELKQYLSNSDIYLFPSLCEGCASSGMEAMAAGLLVVATKESGLPIENGNNGLIVKSKSVDEIVTAILKIWQIPAIIETLGRNASMLIDKNYSWQQYAQKVSFIYNELRK